MTAADLTALLASDLTKADNRAVLNDAMLDAGFSVDLAALFASGEEDGAEMARESGSSDPGAEGWDGILINSIGSRACAELFGLPEDAVGSDAWMACMKVYAVGAQAGADESVAQSLAYWYRGTPYCAGCVEDDPVCMGEEERWMSERAPGEGRCGCCHREFK